MSKDITPILASWDHDPDDLQVRIVPGLDGRDKLQMRVELGLLQMELDGRPDGQKPLGYESLLDYHEARAAGEPDAYRLSSDDCAELMREGIQYYHRYLALFHLERYDLVERDTARNLRLFEFVVGHAERGRDKLQFEQYCPYVLMMNARARGLRCLERGDARATLERIDEGIGLIRDFLRGYHQEDEAECQELTFLKRWRDQVERERHRNPLERLEDQLVRAVAEEQYEEAARIRDQIRRLRALHDPAASPGSRIPGVPP